MRLPIPPPGHVSRKRRDSTIKAKIFSQTKTPETDLEGEVEGTIQGHRDGHGFLIRGDRKLPDLYLSQQEMRAALHGDRVKASIARLDRKGRPEGRILEILERKKAPIIGRLLNENGVWIVVPEDKRYSQDILIGKNAKGQATEGQVVAVRLTEPPHLYAQPVGQVAEVLGDVDDPGIEIEIAVRKFEVPHRFSAEALAHAAKLPSQLRAADLKHRIDLTDVPLVTIDGEDARDFDDAVYCEPACIGRSKSVNGWRLIVAIADVSHYVQPNEPLDVDAHERTTSVYFPRRVIPMLPEKISNGLCSLVPNEDRLSMVCDMLVDANGDVTAYQFYPAVICSQARLTYTEVAAALTNTRGIEAQKHAALLPHLLDLHEVYRALVKQRQRRGAMDFETVETQIVCDASGRIEKIIPRTRNEAHKLIEEAMLAANVCAADFLAQAKQPVLYRVHEGPTPEKLGVLQTYLKALGLGLAVSESPKPSEYQHIAAATKDRPDVQQIHMMLLRSMQQAVYSPDNQGHFGLAYEAYTHFTSPIRRYPDLLVHRAIKAVLAGKRYSRKLGKEVMPRSLSKADSQASELESWEQIGSHCSTLERRADEASRDVEAWLKCRYMRDRLGEEFSGTVSTVVGFGLFVVLDALYVEGLVHISELGGDYYRFDEARQELRGERSGMRYTVGTRLRVQVSRVDLDARRIDFRMVKDTASAAALAEAPAQRSRRAPSNIGSAIDELEAVQIADRAVKAKSKAKAQAKLGTSVRKKASAKKKARAE